MMHTGVIKVVDHSKGLGYVQEPDGREIVLITLGLEDMLTTGMPVTYTVKQTRRGVIAVDVKPIVH